MKKLLLLIPFVALIIGCGGGGEADYYPLAAGNEWNFSLTVNVTTPDTTLTFTGTQDQKITEETTLDDNTPVFEQMTIMTTNIDTLTTMVDTSIVYEEKTADYIFEYESKADTVPDTALALPLEEGKTWNVNSETKIVVIGQEDVTVPAGSYTDCWKAAVITGSDTGYAYVAPDIGFVKMDMIETNADTTNEIHIELEDVNLQ